MNIVSKFDDVKIFCYNCLKELKEKYDLILIKLEFLEEINLSDAIILLRQYEVVEAFNKLKRMHLLWPNNERANELLTLLYIIDEKENKALKIIEQNMLNKDNYEKYNLLIKDTNKIKTIQTLFIEGVNVLEIEKQLFIE